VGLEHLAVGFPPQQSQCHDTPEATSPQLLAAQMTDNQRRTSAVPSPKIPPAPPLPLPKQKARSYFERFVAQPLTTAYASRPSVQARNGGLPNPLVPKLPGYVSSFFPSTYLHGTDCEVLQAYLSESFLEKDSRLRIRQQAAYSHWLLLFRHRFDACPSLLPRPLTSCLAPSLPLISCQIPQIVTERFLPNPSF
jgi:hypothetical protein